MTSFGPTKFAVGESVHTVKINLVPSKDVQHIKGSFTSEAQDDIISFSESSKSIEDDTITVQFKKSRQGDSKITITANIIACGETTCAMIEKTFEVLVADGSNTGAVNFSYAVELPRQ
ncbi:hypothetical protein AKO1_001097 [Acrasis kona]|uniref:Uncharacterized protein n=1 Tax=Acrasis kona TaxID=1008807 RepID=A0AAW2ZBY9_9EUKA